MEKRLKLFTYINGTKDAPFPNKKEQIEICSFEYHADRMGGAPYISAQAKHRRCLDDLWTEKVYAKFNGERFFIMNTPSSVKNNTDERYTHTLTLLSEREILNHVYFIDAVQGDSSVDQVVSNSTKVKFMGNLDQFVARLNSSLSYTNVPYIALVDAGITTEEKVVSFDDKYVLEALQEAFKAFDVPYYFVGRVIHFGYNENVIPTPFRYGFDDSLLSISKENQNYKVINRITGMGGTENIPYYYPNASPKGNVRIIAGKENKGIKQRNLVIMDGIKFAEKFSLSDKCIYKVSSTSPNVKITDTRVRTKGSTTKYQSGSVIGLGASHIGVVGRALVSAVLFVDVDVEFMSKLTLDYSCQLIDFPEASIEYDAKELDAEGVPSIPFINGNTLSQGVHKLMISIRSVVSTNLEGKSYINGKFNIAISSNKEKDWFIGDKKVKDFAEYGILVTGTPQEGDYFTQDSSELIPFSTNLMPPIYRDSKGKERFYNALDDTYQKPDGSYYSFPNKYRENNRLEGKYDFTDIKPTIKGMTNNLGERIDMFKEFAYDAQDNDEVDKDGKYLHPYFFAKMRKTDGSGGFNLFTHTNEKQTMQISMTSGVCGACNFEIQVGSETQLNPVQVDETGDLVRDENGNVKLGYPQPFNNDTSRFEVWIALKKDNSTYPTFKPMPNFEHKLRPSVNDTFVILGITLPQAYIRAAEERLKDKLIETMFLNNVEKFGFTITFSRIFFSEHPEILAKLNENSRILIEYDNKQYELYVDQFSYKISNNDALPDISVSLVETLTAGKNTLQTMLSGVKQDILGLLGSQDILRLALPYFIRKDVPDAANFLIKLLGGAEFGRYVPGKNGAHIDINGNAELENLIVRGMINAGLIKSDDFKSGSLGTGYMLKTDPVTGRSYMEIDELYVRMKAFFTELQINKLSYAGGNWIFSPAGMDCSGVEEFKDFYRCYFTAQDNEVQIKNEFAIGDLVTAREFNIKSGVNQNISNTFYWRKCVGKGDDYIDLSKNDCAPSSSIPKIGDSMVTLGNASNRDRQNAIIISALGEGSPSITQHTGIRTYSLKGTEKTRISPKENIFTGRFFFTSGEDIETVVNKAVEAADRATEALQKISSDKYVSPSEKPLLKQQKADMVAENAHIKSLSSKYPDVYIGGYTKAYELAIAAYDKYTASTPEYILIEADFDNIAKTYDQRTLVLNSFAYHAKKLATDAQLAADKANENANEAKQRLENWADDNVISPTEKQSLKDEIARIDADKAQITNGYTQYELGEATDFNTKHTAYRNALGELSAPIPETIPIPSDFATKQTAYYDARTNALKAIADAAKKYTDDVITGQGWVTKTEFEANNKGIYGRIEGAKQEAIDDADGKIGTLRTDMETSFEATNGYIESKVSKTDFNSLTNRVDKNESNIQQLPDQIKLEVKKEVNNEVKNISGGGVNMLKESNVMLDKQNAVIGIYYYAQPLVKGNKYTLTICYKLGMYTDVLEVSEDASTTTVGQFKNKTESIESVTFVSASTRGDDHMTFRQNPYNRYGSYVKWAVLTPGELALKDWIPSIYETNQILVKQQASITANSESITSNVKKIEVVDGKVALQESQIKQNADEISATVKSVNELNNKVDAINISGMNILRNTALAKDANYWKSIALVDSKKTLDARNSFKYTHPEDKVEKEDIISQLGDMTTFLPKKDETYTASVYAYTQMRKFFNYTPYLEMRMMDAEKNVLSTRNVVIDAQSEYLWKRYEINGTCPENIKFIEFACVAQKNKDVTQNNVKDTDKILFLNGMKLEKGTKATDWTPNSYDIFEGLVIGGGNLLVNSSLVAKKNPCTDSTISKSEIDTVEAFNGYPSMKVTYSEAGNYELATSWSIYGGIHDAKSAVVSFFAKANTEGRRMFVAIGENTSDTYLDLTKEWKRYVVIVNTPKAWDTFKFWTEQTGIIHIALPKLEYGNVASAWSPAQEDADEMLRGDLLDTGIDIKNKKIVLTAENIEIRDQEGQVNTIFQKNPITGEPTIFAKNLNIDSIEAKDIKVTNASIVGGSLVYEKNELKTTIDQNGLKLSYDKGALENTIDEYGISMGKKGDDQDRWSPVSGIEMQWGDINLLRDTRIRGLKLGEATFNTSEVEFSDWLGRTRSTISNIIILDQNSPYTFKLPVITSNAIIFVKKYQTGKDVTIYPGEGRKIIPSNGSNKQDSYPLAGDISMIFIYVHELLSWIAYYCG